MPFSVRFVKFLWPERTCIITIGIFFIYSCVCSLIAVIFCLGVDLIAVLIFIYKDKKTLKSWVCINSSLVHHRVTTQHWIYTPGLKRATMRVNCLFKNTGQCPNPLDPLSTLGQQASHGRFKVLLKLKCFLNLIVSRVWKFISFNNNDRKVKILESIWKPRRLRAWCLRC